MTAMKLALLTILLFNLILYVFANLRFLKSNSISQKQLQENDTIPKEEWVTQFLNHFNSSESNIWSQRYYTYSAYYKVNGPVFLLLSGGIPADYKTLIDSHVTHLAKEVGAICFLLEHRFFGKSIPTKNLSTENLNYLSIDQALNDITYFIQKVSLAHNLPEGSKWVLFGNFYGGSLAAWMRLKFPHLVYGAVAVSAPITARVDFPELYAITEKHFRKHSEKCADTLAVALEEARVMLSSLSGQEALGRILNLCKPINLPKPTASDITSLFIEFLDSIMLVALTDIGPTLDQACNIMLDNKRGPLINRLAGLVDLSLEAQGLNCTPLLTFEDRVRSLQITDWYETTTFYRIVTFQMCSEVGWCRSTTAKPFKLPADLVDIGFYELLCDSAFEEQLRESLDQRIENTNLIYGGLDIVNTTSRIIFIYGSDDPWKSLGIPVINNPSTISLHVNDVGTNPLQKPPSPNDIPSLVEAKNQVQQLVTDWLRKN